jgi:hypothetical protein
MSWQANAIIYSSIDNGTSYQKWSDHNRAPLDISLERFERANRMANGTLRRYSVAKKRTFTISWEMFPSKITPSYLGRTGVGTVDGGYAGEDIQNLYNTQDGSFKIKLRKGDDEAKTSTDATLEVVNVMFTDFSKSIVKRGVVDFWSLSVTLEEV